MAEAIVSVIADKILVKISSLFFSEISLALGVKKEMKKLETTLFTIRTVLSDAEAQSARNHEVRFWLEKLKDVAYDVDDVLDEFSMEALRRKVEIHGSMLNKVCNFFSNSNSLVFRFKAGHKIKKIRERLDEIAAYRRNFDFMEQVLDVRVENRAREQTHFFVQKSDVMGRDYDKEKIVELLLGYTDHESLSVIPIVGLGGLGKTTLAKLVYNDERVIQNFELRMWVHVSENFDIKILVEKIIKSATGANCEYPDFDQLQRCLQDTLNARKFLLVLDYVWNEDLAKWTNLRDLLVGGASGSRIIVTTRSMTVASIMGTMSSPYKLGGLSDDACLSIFVKWAFKKGDEQLYPDLVEIGKAIVAKCGGNPLAIITLGSLLHAKTDEHVWLCIRDNEIWKLEQNENGILPALMLSYQQMPSYLKQCFAYCSIFPKDYEIGRVSLINHWMAQGYLQSPDTNQQLEDVGNLYFNELMSRSFFQDVGELFDSEIYKFKMQDLVHDLARQIASSEWTEVNFRCTFLTGRTRHVSLSKYDSLKTEFPASLLRGIKLRSFRLSYEVGPINKSFVDTLILHFRCLRLLDLPDSQFEELPSFVGKLKHLRFLRLSWNRSLKKLPNSICKLLNLQSLYLLDCEQLQELPRDIGKLISLRHLYLTSQLIHMPKKGLQGLNSLQSLVLSRCNNLASLSEGIQHLTSLRRLCIDQCQCLASLPSGMKCLIALEKLEILNCQELNLLEGEYLQGLRNLQSLTIRQLPKLVVLPQGLQQSAVNLQYLLIQNCTGLKTLPEWLKDLKSLLRLHIIDCNNLLSLPELSIALQELSIRGCQHLSTRC